MRRVTRLRKLSRRIGTGCAEAFRSAVLVDELFFFDSLFLRCATVAATAVVAVLAVAVLVMVLVLEEEARDLRNGRMMLMVGGLKKSSWLKEFQRIVV
jgi:hypothetical protein